MSVNAVVLQTASQLFVTTDLAKIFVYNNRYSSGTFEYDNSLGADDVTIVAGTVLGRIGATQKLVILDKDASDGSQYPVGILAQDVVALYGEELSQSVDFCVEGDVAQEQLAFAAGTTLATVISGRTVADRIGADTVGVKLVATDEQTFYDNQ